MSRRKTFFGESLLMNNSTYLMYFYHLLDIAMSRYKWINLPKTCNSRYLELSLIMHNAAVFIKDDVAGIVTLSALPSGQKNIYGDPLTLEAYSIYSDVRLRGTNENSVFVWNNQLHTSDFCMLQMFAKRLYNLDRTIDVNVGAQKTPVLLTGPEGQQLTLRNIYKDYDGNAPVIYGEKGMEINSLRCLKTDAPYVADKLYELKVFYWNEALTYLGIPNTNVMKKERVITDEVQRAQAGAFASRNSSLYARQAAKDRFNHLWPGYDVDVVFNISDTDTFDLPDSDKSHREEVISWQSTPQRSEASANKRQA